MSEKYQLTILGTGNALVTECFNTCFLLKTPKTLFLTDTGGGNGILRQLKYSGADLSELDHLYITHAHTDHLLGAPWLLRSIAAKMRSGKHPGDFYLYSHTKVISIINYLLGEIFSQRDLKICKERLHLGEVEEGKSYEIGDLKLVPFDIQSTKEKQYGYRLTLPDGRILVCLGDEPFNEHCREYAMNADLLMSEAFCLKAEAERFKPYEKHHSTAFDAGLMATDLKAKTLLLYHTEDESLSTRRERYSAEAAENFKGQILVPDDLEVIEF